MRFSILKIMTASVVLFFGCQTSLMAEDSATSQKADEQPAAQSTARAPTATIPPQQAWRGYYPHRPYYRPYRRRDSGSGFGFGSGSGPSFGSSRGPGRGWDNWGRDPFFDDPFMNDPHFGRDPWRRNRSGSGSGIGFGSGSGPSFGSSRGPGRGWDDRGRDPFFDDPFMNDPHFGRDPWRRNRSGSGIGFGSGSGPSWGSGSGPRFHDRGRGPRDWDSGGMGFGW